MNLRAITKPESYKKAYAMHVLRCEHEHAVCFHFVSAAFKSNVLIHLHCLSYMPLAKRKSEPKEKKTHTHTYFLTNV